MSHKKIQVLLVDDSAVIRGLITRLLEADPEIEIVASRANGKAAISAAEKHKPDVALLDIEMPIMDGITALPEILKVSPDTKVLICSTVSGKNADISLKALSLGASECILKPTASRDISGREEFRRNLLNLVRTLGGRPARDFDKEELPKSSKPGVHEQDNIIVRRPDPAAGQISLRPPVRPPFGGYKSLAIGSSTGGPQALFKVLKDVRDLKVPIFITQHMPPTFTKILADHISHNTDLQAHEAQEGMKVENGHVYVAAGGRHMLAKKNDDDILLVLDDGSPENYCKPSVDPMLRSLLKIYRTTMLTVILTGMGHDGYAACHDIAQEGGPIIAQDKQSSVVWGMPGAVATNGLCNEVLPLDEIGAKINSYLAGK